MNAARLIIACALTVTLAGCANTHQAYNWGRYDPALYAYYKVPANEPQFEAALLEIIQPTGSKTGAVPPGIFAEYGYLRLQQGNPAEAVQFFRQEEAHWPESRVFMERMIKVAEGPVAAPAAPVAPVAPASTDGPKP